MKYSWQYIQHLSWTRFIQLVILYESYISKESQISPYEISLQVKLETIKTSDWPYIIVI